MVLLIQPRAGKLEKIGKRLPLGILYLASYLKKHNISAEIVDTRINKRWKKDLLRKLKYSDYIGISCMIGPMIKNALKIAAYAKKYKPGVTVILGGAHPSLLPEQALNNPDIDIVARGEGEETLREILSKKPLETIKGISYKKNNSILHNATRGLLNAEEIPVPDYSLIDIKNYSATTYADEKSISVMASRGCPYSCGFCYLSGTEHKNTWRPFPVDTVIKNIKILKREYGIKSFYFEDDNIAADRRRFLEILKKLKSYNINLAFQGIRIDSLDKFTDDDFRVIQECGVKSLDIGIESISDRVLRMIDKKLASKKILAALNKLKKHNFNLKFNFLAGLPGQSRQEIETDLAFIRILDKDHPNSFIFYNIYMPFPNTRLYKSAISAGFSPPKDFLGWSEFTSVKWMKKHSWLNKKDRQYLEALNFLFMFSNKNIISKINRKYVRILVRLYQPIARLRLSRKWFRFLIEKRII